MYNNKFNPVIFDLINNKKSRLRIALALNVTEQAIRNAIKYKRDVLTKKAALDIILEETGLTEEEIFETSKFKPNGE